MPSVEVSSDRENGVSLAEKAARKRDVIAGGLKAAAFIKAVEMGKRIGGKRMDYDSNLVLEIHRRVEFRSHEAGKFRQNDPEVNTEETVKYTEVPTRFYLFGRWLQHQVEETHSQPDNIVLALETAAAAHEGLTSPELHPFSNGNGRTARALVNAILMHSTDELRLHGIAILPVPILREDSGSRDNKYIRALMAVDETRSLNPLMSYIAQRWIENLDKILEIITKHVNGRPLNSTDMTLIDTMRQRRERLLEFVSGGNGHNGDKKGDYTVYPVPNYFDPIWLKDDDVA